MVYPTPLQREQMWYKPIWNEQIITQGARVVALPLAVRSISSACSNPIVAAATGAGAAKGILALDRWIRDD